MKAIQLKYVAVAALFVLGLANQSLAADAAEAAGVMTDLESLVTEAQKIISAGASDLDQDAIKEAKKRSAEIDNAVQAGRKAQAAMGQALANGDTEAADAAEAALAAALLQSRNALVGIFPETAAPTTTAGDDSEEKDYDPPNIYDVPWKSQGIRAYYQSLFGSFHDASAFGGQKGFGDRDATQE